jgi:hypothetical protein
VPEANGLTLPSAYNVACGYALSGKADEAIDWLSTVSPVAKQLAELSATPDDVLEAFGLSRPAF